MKLIVGQLICVSIFLVPLAMAVCDRRPMGATDDRSPADDNFQIYIEGNPSSYMPGQKYNISLACDSKLSFVTFTLAVDTEDLSLMYQSNNDMLGHFELIDIADTKFSLQCENMIESANTNKKSRIDVAWIAPNNNASGCVIFRAGLLQNRYVWHIDDGFLTKRFCPEEIDEINGQTPPVDPCCACDEAKYEIILERKWSRNTHPKDFPEQSWRTRFSEVIGASHTFDYKFWEYGTLASAGLKALAEHGATSDLEYEIKQNISYGSIRTIIKAPGILHRHNVMGSTLANVRVDSTHHIISLVSKIFPSPDWIIGVSGLELCLGNCTWIDSKVLNLYPWDVGTDAGPSYMSADQPQIPPDVIRRITSTSPSDVRSPFFDETGQQMKPIATLYVTKKKIYERKCEYDFGEGNENQALECATHPWNNWSECNIRCGPGTQHRVRVYKDPSLAENYKNCRVELEQEQNCMGTDCNVPDIGEESMYDSNESAECALSTWSAWSQCSKSCGLGYKIRTREYLKPYAIDRCQRRSFVKLDQRQSCIINKCGGSLDESYYNENDDNNQPDDQYNTNNRRPQSGRFGSNRNSYQNQAFGERDDNQYGENIINQNNNRNSYQNQPFGERDGNQYGENINYQNNYDPTSNVNENDRSISGYGSNTYGSENLIGQNQRSYDRNNINPQDSNNNFNPNSNRNNFGTSSNTRHPFPTPPTSAPRTPYFGNINPNEDNNPSQFSFNGESNDPENDKAVEEFCLRKPYPSDVTCDFKEIVTKNFWLYDADDLECKIFTSDNCDKNENKFNTLKKCEEVCLKPHQNQLRRQGNFNGNVGVDGYDAYGNARGFGMPQSQIKPSWTRKTALNARRSIF